MKKMLLALLLIPELAHGTCYTLTNSQGQILYNNTQPPFDLSGPPDSAAYAASKKQGQKLKISPHCHTTEISNEQIAQKLSDRDQIRITTIVNQQIKEQEYIERQIQFNREAKHQLLRSGEQSAKWLRRYNDLNDNFDD